MGDIVNFNKYFNPKITGGKRFKNDVIDLNTYTNNKFHIEKNKACNKRSNISNAAQEAYDCLNELWDLFYDYAGQDLYDRIQSGKKITQNELNMWHCKNTQEFLATWRGNSEKAFRKWLKDKGYES